MPRPIIYGFAGSSYVRSARSALEEKEVAYDFVDTGVGPHKEREHLCRNPFGLVPAFEHGDFQLYETQAIIRYIDDAFGGPALQPQGIYERARMNQLIGIVDSHVRTSISAVIFIQRLVEPHHGRAPDETLIATAMPQARICVQEIARLMGSRPFLVGDQVTIADLLLFPQMDYFSMTPEGVSLLAESPEVGSWLTRMAGRRSMQVVCGIRADQPQSSGRKEVAR
jgi:glutathione S-transferase